MPAAHIHLWVHRPSELPKIVEALEKLKQGYLPDIEDAVLVLMAKRWGVQKHNRLPPPPPDRDVSDITIGVIYDAAVQVNSQSGANTVADLFAAYGITRLSDLPANRMAAFYADLKSAYYRWGVEAR